MTKKVDKVTAKQFGFLYIGGIPHNPAKVKRFLTMGGGVKLGDVVIYDAESDRVLSYVKNAKYAEGEERALVKQYVKDVALREAGFDTTSVSDEILNELAEEGVSITNDGTITVQGGKVTISDEADEMKEQIALDALEEDIKLNFDGDDGSKPQTEEDQELTMDLDPELVSEFTQNMKKDMSIMLQSSLKAAIELYKDMAMCPRKRSLIRAETITIALWIDTNSTNVMDMASKLRTLQNEREKPTFKKASQS